MPSFSTENVLFFPFSNLFFGSELLSTPTFTGGRSEGLGSGRWNYASSPEGGSIWNSSVWMIYVSLLLFVYLCHRLYQDGLMYILWFGLYFNAVLFTLLLRLF